MEAWKTQWHEAMKQMKEKNKEEADNPPRLIIHTTNHSTTETPAWDEALAAWQKQQMAWEEMAYKTGPYTTYKPTSVHWGGVGKKSVAELRTYCDFLYKDAMVQVINITLDAELTKAEQAELIGEVVANLYNAIIKLDPEFAKQELLQFE